MLKMNKEHEIEQILNEILEHTADCDCNRSQHFKEYDRYSKWDNFFNITQAIILIALVSFFMLKSDFPCLDEWSWAPIILSAIATALQLMDYYFDCGTVADHHWMAAQAYSRLYRQCQFFPSNYANASLDEIRAVARSISSELYDLNIMSPDLNDKTYRKVKDRVENKKYPIQEVFRSLRVERINDAVERLKEECVDYFTEIYIFGSYLDGLVNHDVDIAVIVHQKDVTIDQDSLNQKAIEIENDFSGQNINLDITIITEKELNDTANIPFIRNILKGERIYSNIERETGRSVIYLHNNYNILIEKFYTEANNAKDNHSVFVSKVFSFYYFIIANILERNNIDWNGEDSLLHEFRKIAGKNNEYLNIQKEFRRIQKIRQKMLTNASEFHLENISNIENGLEYVHTFYQTNLL